jgi:hypothetical protein
MHEGLKTFMYYNVIVLNLINLNQFMISRLAIVA